MAYQPARHDGENATLHTPISANGYAEKGQEYLIPARQGRAVKLRQGEVLEIINPQGNQVCDFFALTLESSAEFLGMEQCRTSLGRVYVNEGDVLVTNRRRPLIEIVKDTSPGVHDILIACCDLPRYRDLGVSDYHDNCADNFRMALSAIGIEATHVPSPFNIWMNIPLKDDGSYSWEAPVSKAGDTITLKALADCVAVMSACPQDITPVNGIGVEPSELIFRVS